MNHRHRKILHSLFSHPLPSNSHLHDVEAVFRELGGEVGDTGSGRLRCSLKGQSASLRGSGHGLSKDEVSHVRKFIESCGIEPSRDFPI